MGLGTQLKLCPRLRFGRGLGEVPPMGTQLKLCPRLRFGRGLGEAPHGDTTEVMSPAGLVGKGFWGNPPKSVFRVFFTKKTTPCGVV
jgi:hypothetical protein